MISTRPLYPSEYEFYRRSDRGPHMPLSQNSHIHDQYETGSHLSSRTTPTSEPDSRATSGSRKRVPVACERCRKRKIKCSGNEGDSQACANCKNSGLEDSCRFLRVSSVEPGHLGFRGWHGPPRYSPYSLPTHHRLNYMSMASRCTPQNTLQYHTLPSSIDYSPYTSQATSVDWARAPYVGHVGPYSPYADDDETSPYTAQPPPYILPNTDPMSTNNTYYMHGHGVRPHPTSLWPEPQHYVSQSTSQLPNTAYTMTNEGPQSFQAIGTAGNLNLPSGRLLPQPFTARSYIPTPASSIDIPVSTPSQRNHSYWHGETGTSVQQLATSVEATSSQEQASERETVSYRIQDMTYGQTNLDEGLPVTSGSSDTYLAINEPRHSTLTTSTEDAPSQHSTLNMVTPESQKSGVESSVSSRSSQLRSDSGQVSAIPLYCRATMIPRRELGTNDCSLDRTSC